MNNRLEILNWKRNRLPRRGLRSSRVGTVSSREISPAAQKDALRTVDTAIKESVGPAGVPGWSGQLREKLILAIQTPAGGGGMIAQTVPRDWSVVGMTFSPKGSFSQRRIDDLKDW
jgi:hypothetical protein